MKVFIAGAGEVGTHLANMLGREDIDVILMDANPKTLKSFIEKGELLTVVGDPTSIGSIGEYVSKDTDLFISVMPEETANIVACILAKKLGAKNTIARVNKSDYFDGKTSKILSSIGIGSIIYPEALASEEIISIIEHPWARQYLELFSGAIILVGVKVRTGSTLVGKQLKELSSESKIFHIVAIRRDLETIIPTGDTFIMHGDIVFFTTTPEWVENIRLLCAKCNPPVVRVVIMGASRIAIRVARSLLKRNIQVSIIDSNKEHIERLIASGIAPESVNFFYGDGRRSDILEDAGIENAEVFIALTQNSETNVLACLAAKSYSNIFKTIAKEENIDYIHLAGRLDIGTLINKKLITAGYIYKNLLGADAGNVKCLTVVGCDVAEFIAHRQSKIIGHRIADIALPKGITIGGLVRGGVPSLVSGDTIIQPYDAVVVFSIGQGLGKISELFD